METDQDKLSLFPVCPILNDTRMIDYINSPFCKENYDDIRAMLKFKSSSTDTGNYEEVTISPPFIPNYRSMAIDPGHTSKDERTMMAGIINASVITPVVIHHLHAETINDYSQYCWEQRGREHTQVHIEELYRIYQDSPVASLHGHSDCFVRTNHTAHIIFFAIESLLFR